MAETTELKKSDFYFDLPQELIAQDPLEDRSSSRLLVLDKNTGEISHHIFRDIIDYLHPGDCLVLNNTKVIPARSPSIKTKRSGCLGDSGKAWQEMQARSAPDLRGWTIKGRSPGDCGRR